MANLRQDLRQLKKHRYSIQDLLSLSGMAYSAFDLSKFSFDAARAGVVPSLGDCASSVRRASGNQPRTSSGESVCASDSSNVIAASGWRKTGHRSQPPPLTKLAQQHDGFARFLKKHSSPTHQRVTAGGRIVPMDQCQAPPVFSLTPAAQANSNNQNHTTEREVKPAPASASDTSQTTVARIQNINQPKVIPSTSFGLPEALTTSQTVSADSGWGSKAYKQDSQHTFAINNTSGIHPHVSAMDSISMPWSNYIPSSPCTYGPWPAILSTHGIPVHSAANNWHWNDGMTSPSLPTCPVTTGYLAQPTVWAQNALSDWTHRYDELDQQLKALDRHRAMTNLTFNIASQRREIVQQRADSKNMINLISSWLNLSQQVQSDINSHACTQSFNANATPYVPLAQQLNFAERPLSFTENAQATVRDGRVATPPLRSARRPIPIVRPPTMEMNASLPEKEENGSRSSPGCDPVDSWGVKIGPAPPALRKQQSEILESISDAQSVRSYSNPSQESLQSPPPGSFFQHGDVISPSASTYRQSTDRVEGPQNPSAHDTIHFKEMHKDGLGTFRQSQHTNERSRFSNGPKLASTDYDVDHAKSGSRLHVESGHRSPRPRQARSEAQERQNGQGHGNEGIAATPVKQQRLASNPESTRRINGEDGKENIAFTPTAHRKSATDAFLARYNGDGDGEDEPLSLYASRSYTDGDSPTKQERPRTRQMLGMRLGNRNEVPSHKTSSDGERPVAGKSQVSVQGSSLADSVDHTYSSAFNNKGYSSTSLQSVTATAYLPQNMDGSADRGASSKSILSLVGKVKSPRLLRRTTATSGAWYGPHCREVIERALVSENTETGQQKPK